MVIVRGLSGSFTLPTEAGNTVLDLKRRIALHEGIAVEDQVLVYSGSQLVDEELLDVEEASTLYLSLRLLGGGKKRKKKVYSTPKKNKHKRKKVKLAALKFYEVDDNGKIRRLRKECTAPSCGGGVFMASHKNRFYCGKCHETLVVEEGSTSGPSGGGKGKGKK